MHGYKSARRGTPVSIRVTAGLNQEIAECWKISQKVSFWNIALDAFISEFWLQKSAFDFKVVILAILGAKMQITSNANWTVWKFKWDFFGHFPTRWTVCLLSSFKTLLLFVCVQRTKESLMSSIITMRVLITLATICLVFKEGNGCQSPGLGYVTLIFLLGTRFWSTIPLFL